jgi:hypothetical protein
MTVANSGLTFVLGLSATVRDFKCHDCPFKSRKDLETKEELILDLSAAWDDPVEGVCRPKR